MADGDSSSDALAFDSSTEATIHNLVSELLSPEIDEPERIRKMNWLAEVLEKAEAAFRQTQPSPARRDGHLVGHLFRILDDFEDFYTMLERKLQGDAADRVRNERMNAAVCRLFLATSPVHTRFIVRTLYEEDVLDRVCRWAEGAPGPLPPHGLQLQCYAAGLLSVGLRDRSIADTVVNHATLPVSLLRRSRYYAMALENERAMALEYMATMQQKKLPKGAKKPSSATTPTAAKRRKLSIDKTTCIDDASPSLAGADISDRLVHGLQDDTPSMTPEDIARRHEEPPKQLLLLDLLYCLECLGLMGEYLELLAPALKEDVLGTIVTFLHSPHPTLWSATLKLTSHFLAHKKFAFSFLDAGGLQLVLGRQRPEEIALLHRSMSMCLHGFASSSVVMETIFRRESDRSALLLMALTLLGSPHDKARQNAVVFFGLVLPFRSALEFFEANDGVYILLNLIRAGNAPKTAAQRQLAHDACLCLRQYVRVHFGLLVYALRRKLHGPNSRMPKLSPYKPIDIDDKSHETHVLLFEKHGKGLKDAKWVLGLMHLRAPLVLLEVLNVFCKQSSRDLDQEPTSYRVWLVERAQFSLQALRLLTLVHPPIAPDVCATTLADGRKSGLSIVLECAMSTHFRDGDIVRDALHVFGNCVYPPIKAKESSESAAVKSILKLARDKSALKVCLSLLRYKRSLQHADSVRFLAARALLGLSRDRHVAQILEQMQIGQLLSDLIRHDPVLEENADLHLRFKEVALELISHVTHRVPSSAIHEATDPTVRKIEKANIVAATHITYNPNDLLLLIHDHLKANGLHGAADALETEAQLKQHASSSGPGSPNPRRRRFSKRLKPDVKLGRVLSFAQRKKHVARQLNAPHYFETPVVDSVKKKALKRDVKTTWLDTVVRQYCREQHRQCPNPVAIVPPFSLASSTPHECPDVAMAAPTYANIGSSLVVRSALGSTRRVDTSMTRFVYGRHRAFRVVSHGTDVQGGLTAAKFLSVPRDRHILLGTDQGELCYVNLEQDAIVGRWQCHLNAGPITSISTNEHTRLAFSHASPLVLTGTSRLSQYVQATIGLWDLGRMETPRWTLPGMRAGTFNHAGDRVVAMAYEAATHAVFDPSIASPVRGTAIYEVETGSMVAQLEDPIRPYGIYGDATNCVFSPCDTTVLADGMLWDLRVSRALHQFDKLSNDGYGYFHPTGNEVFINSAVWDLRTFKLRRMVPALEQSRVAFNHNNTVLYAYSPFEPLMKESSKKMLKHKTWFRVLDARDYKDISTVDVERPIYDVSLNYQETLLAIVEGRYLDSVYGEDTPVCRLYEVGRNKPNEADSDLEDNVEESESMEDDDFESTSSLEEEEEVDEEDDEDDVMEANGSLSDDDAMSDDDAYSEGASSQGYDTEDLHALLRLEIPDNAYLTFGSEYDDDDEDGDDEMSDDGDDE
ncbi:hypothetical protein SPRG_08673 [Saprolegnia parasitica CBS 223.65]|uniref:Uncharacterized protein n=1 Tax=Saprolegnia parasitica (strain CBS 223.65) TaxID=695850 RepID=A0A067CA16_SAPPC|nr:hypothetical protein SPRG_08673 [Saprolegnia parasitica CBS 223.65]KDO26020.1 hypothetical protein SPRG_08673 [Saprolegnia parasitica CBS 223.65]|eukprot:XP_012203306.1 hypothetical protein SPRG_08673 [Saprolegnia parasitica CBS 223.65]